MIKSNFSLRTLRAFACCTIVSAFAFVGLPSSESAEVVVPGVFFSFNEGDTSEGTSLGSFSNTAQVVYNSDILSSSGLQAGDVIFGLAFRLDVNNLSVPASVNFTNYEIRLGQSLNSAGFLDPVLANNRGADYSVVRSGPLDLLASDIPVGGFPNDFIQPFLFNNGNYTYQGGDLLLEYTHTAVPDTGVFADATDFSTFGGAFDSIIQSQFAPGFDGAVEGFDGFGIDFAPIVQFSVVPEPSSTVMLAIASIVGLVYRRRRS